MDFFHREQPFQAHVFLCRFTGEGDGEPYSFRKCHARGCSHHLCPHVSQAVMIANRYLLRDCRMLREAGVSVPEGLFTLEEMVAGFLGYQEKYEPTLTIEDYVHIAGDGNEVSVEISLEYVSAVEHFGNYDNPQTFLMVHFHVESLGRTHKFQRCFACYSTENEEEERKVQTLVANGRLQQLYQDFDRAGVKCERKYFVCEK